MELPEYSVKASLGYHFGLKAEKAVSKHISIEAGTAIDQVFWNYAISDTNLLSQQHVQYTYPQTMIFAEIPVLAKYYFNMNSFRPYVEAGVSVRILLNNMEQSDDFGKYWFTNSSNSDKILTTFLTDSENFGFLLGAGISYDLNRSSIVLNVRYNHYLNKPENVAKFDQIYEYRRYPAR